MKAYIGPYKNWFGPYQLAETICFWHKYTRRASRDEDNYVDKLGDWFSKRKWLMRFFEWNYRGGHNRKIKVKIHDYDTWNMDDTLSHIIYPMLVQLKATKQGAPSVDNEDVPEHLHRPEGSKEWETDEHWFARWNYVLDEMIWSFSAFTNEEEMFMKEDGSIDMPAYEEHHNRLRNGFRLFGKYYQGLWD